MQSSRPPLATKTRSSSARTSSKKKDKSSKSRVSVAERDYLEQDPPLRGQRYVCLSFISPEDEIRNKEIFTFNEFLKNFSSDVDSLFKNMQSKFSPPSKMEHVDEGSSSDGASSSSPSQNSVPSLYLQEQFAEANKMIEAVKSRYDYIFDVDSLEQQYNHFKQLNNQRIDLEYSEKNDFRTNIRGVKIRGVFESILEAKNRSAYLKKVDPKTPDIYVADMGCWIPWSPYPDDIEDQEYSETDLNTLMKRYRENAEQKDEHFAQRKAALTQKINKEQDEKKKKKMIEKINEEDEEEEEDSETTENGERKQQKQNAKDIVEEAFTQDDPWMQTKMSKKDE